MPERLIALAKSVLAVVAAIVGLALWGARLEYQVAQKANQSEVEALQSSVERVDERTARIEAQLIRFICAERPTDTGCQR